MAKLLWLSSLIDALNRRIGRAVMWLVLAAVLVSAANAVVRKTLSTSSNAWLELQWQMFGAVFMLCAAYTLLSNEHVRIDIVSNAFSKRMRDWIELVGHLFFLIPLALLMLVYGWPFFLASWRLNEQSMNAGGLPQWPAKFLIPLGFALLLLQGLAETVKRIAVLRGLLADPHAASAPAEHAARGGDRST